MTSQPNHPDLTVEERIDRIVVSLIADSTKTWMPPTYEELEARIKRLVLEGQAKLLEELHALPNVYPEKVNGEYTHVQAIYKSAIAERWSALNRQIEGLEAAQLNGGGEDE